MPVHHPGAYAEAKCMYMNMYMNMYMIMYTVRVYVHFNSLNMNKGYSSGFVGVFECRPLLSKCGTNGISLKFLTCEFSKTISPKSWYQLPYQLVQSRTSRILLILT